MKCIIVDDEETSRVIISQFCAKTPGLSVMGVFSNAIQAMKYLNDEEVDLIFLDIHMPEFTGFDFINTIKSKPKIILTTSDANFAIKAFEYDCILDYLLKPITSKRFNKAISKVQSFNKVGESNLKNLNRSNPILTNNLYVSIDRRLVKIDFSSIFFIEAKGDYIKIKTENKDYIVHSTLKKISDKLQDSTFLKVHRSYIINISKITDIEDSNVIINKHVIPVSRSKRPGLIEQLNLL